MKNNLKHIDDFFKKHLEGFESHTSVNLWRKLSWLLLLKKFGFWIGIGAVLSGMILTYFLLSPSENINQSGVMVNNNRNTDSSINFSNYKDKISKSINKNNKREYEIDLKIINSTDNIKQTSEEPETYISTKNTYSEQAQVTQVLNEQVKSNSDSKFQLVSTTHESDNIVNSISLLPILNQEKIAIEPIEIHTNLINIKNNSHPLSTVPDPEKTKQKSTFANEWSLDLFINPSIVDQSISANSNYENHINYRENSEDPAISVGFGAEIKYSFNGFFLQSGLNYSIYAQKYQYKLTTINTNYYYLYDTTWIWIVDPPIIEPYPTSIDSTLVPVYEPTTSTTTGKNQYHYLEIPLLVGYQHKFKKVNIEIGTGVSYGFFISANGKLPEISNTSFLDLNKQTDLIQNNFNFLLYVGLEYKLNNKWGILLKPNYKQNLNSIFSSDFPVKQKFTTFGLAFGVRINL